MIRKMLWRTLLAMTGLSLSASTWGEPDRIPIHLGGAQLEAEVAADPAHRNRGLSGRYHLASDSGMLFVWPREGQRTFWMKDTFLPLSIAFLDARGRVLNMATMEPLRQDRFYRSQGGARFALEVNRGWFREHGVESGDRARFRIPARFLPGEEPLRLGSD